MKHFSILDCKDNFSIRLNDVDMTVYMKNAGDEYEGMEDQYTNFRLSLEDAENLRDWLTFAIEDVNNRKQPFSEFSKRIAMQANLVKASV